MRKGMIWAAGIGALVAAAAAISEMERVGGRRVELPEQAEAALRKAPEAERRMLRRRLEAPFRRLMEDPAMRARLEGLTPDAARAEGARLARAGIWMLPDSLLIDRAMLMEEIERRVSTEDCAAIAAGTPTPGAMERGLATFDADELTRWFSLAMDASLRAVRQDPAAEVISDAEAQRLLRAASRRMPPRLRAMIYEPAAAAAATPADLCQIDRHLNRFVIERGGPEGTGLMRWLMRRMAG
ncbi:MAG TPA: hypothetical protein VFQ45_19995 [Longimicrobium sp.]|nr:hypothetical protein [Longimicrobium sp.]